MQKYTKMQTSKHKNAWWCLKFIVVLRLNVFSSLADVKIVRSFEPDRWIEMEPKCVFSGSDRSRISIFLRTHTLDS